MPSWIEALHDPVRADAAVPDPFRRIQQTGRLRLRLLLREAAEIDLKIVVLSPHRDDAAFSVGLAVASWLAAGRSVEVLNCFTRSEYAPYSDAESLHPNDRMSFVTALRRREDECWRRLCGNSLALTDLRLKDAPIRLRCSLQDICRLEVRPEEKAFSKIRSAVAGCEGALVLPLAIGAHVDHLTARDAALSALDGSVPYAFYEDLPYAGQTGAASPESVVEQLASSLKCDLQPVFAGTEADAAARKRNFALCYDSQINDDVANQVAEFCRRYGGRERLWANQAWRSAEPAA